MTSKQFSALCSDLERGYILPGHELDRLGNGAMVGLCELQEYLPALEAAYRRKCNDIKIMQARIRTLEQEIRKTKGG